MADIDTNKIVNIIADIQSEQERIEFSEKEVARLEIEIEEEKEALKDSRYTIKGLRDELEAYLDEIIPDEDSERSLPDWHHRL